MTIKSIEEFHKLQRDLAARPVPAVEVRVCSTGCRARGALAVCDAFDEQIAGGDLGGQVRVVRTGCLGLCAGAVAVNVTPPGVFYREVTTEDVADIL
ncbi:MAG: (2Fe-2S) ferredoxin domain-containing protein [Planctomycetes bacterium]|nr:(2Fe-2S) ferredoxin domain-containing protein [Planctomycetota bacterium]